MYCQRNLNRLFARDLPVDWDELPENVYLVGGAVRDALLHRQKDYIDLDFVVGEKAIALAKAIASRHRAGFVVLDASREIARVVFERGTLDFARMEGESLEIDLKRRDFTVNALAYDPRARELIDPLGGLEDLRKKQLRMVSQENLQDDPLRNLRAYRQAAQLDFTIEGDTLVAIRSLAGLLSRVAAERVRSELDYLLRDPRGDRWLEQVWRDGLLRSWLSRITEEKMARIPRVGEAAQQLEAVGEHRQSFSPANLQMVKLSLLVSSVAEEAEKELIDLKYSRSEIRTVLTMLKNFPRLDTKGEFSPRELYFLFLDTGKIFPLLALRAAVMDLSRSLILSLYQAYLDPDNPIAHPKPLLTGNDLIARLHLKPSPIVGKMLTEIQIAAIEGKISNFEEAIAFARELTL
jgi:tRNA nucleotidyltransferase (CCA-adding enzyme)